VDTGLDVVDEFGMEDNGKILETAATGRDHFSDFIQWDAEEYLPRVSDRHLWVATWLLFSTAKRRLVMSMILRRSFNFLSGEGLGP